MTGEDEYAVVECDNYFDPCCDPRYQDLCEDDYYPEDYYEYDEEDDECEEE